MDAIWCWQSKRPYRLNFSSLKLAQPKGWKNQRLACLSLLLPWMEASKRTTAFDDARQFLSEHKRWDRFPRTYQGYVKALRGQHRQLADALWYRFQQRVETLSGSSWRWRKWVPLALDGSRLECPRTPANEAALGCAGRKKTGPQIQITELWHMPTALPWSATFGPGTVNEQVAFRTQFDQLPPQSLIVADAGFYSYETAQALIARGHAFVIRVGGNKELVKELFGADNYDFGPDQQVYAWPDGIRRQGKPPLSLRLIEIPTANAEEPNVFLLTPLSRHELSDEEAGQFYAQRWGAAEIGYRTHKQTLHAAKVRSRTPDLALCEAEWTVLSIFLLGALTLQHCPLQQVPRNNWSPAGTLHVVRDRIKHSTSCGGRWSRRISRDLRSCYIDRSPRRGPKSTRRHPQKKKEKPPQPPNLRPPNPTELRCVAALVVP